MLNEKEMHKAALRKLIDIKGKDYVLRNKNDLYACWNIDGDVAALSILLSHGNDDSIFDSEGNIVIDETKKAKE